VTTDMDVDQRDGLGQEAGRAPSRSSRLHATSPAGSSPYEEREEEGSLAMLSGVVGGETLALPVDSTRGRIRQKNGPALKGVGARTAPDHHEPVATTHRAACHR
jgi:hypothetical protein